MLSPYRIQPNNANKRTKSVSKANLDNNSHRGPDAKRPRLTSFDFKTTSKESFIEVKPIKNKNKLIGGANIEINDEYLDEILHNNKI